MSNRNEITGDSIINSKGDHRKYAENYEKIFGKKEKPKQPDEPRKKGKCR